MTAPQLPHVILDGDWFRPDTEYSVWSIARCASQSSSTPSQYSRETTGLSLESTKSSISSQLTSQDHVLQQPRLPANKRSPHDALQELTSTHRMAPVPAATPDNDFLGFCRGAWNLQNGDQKGAMKRCSEADAWSRNAAKKPGHAQYLKCREPKCDFRSNFVASNAFLIWNKVFTFEERGIKLRWSFLGKSHVPQRVVLNSKYSFQCLFCVYLGRGEASTVYTGMELYLDHISKKHRSKLLGDVVEYKTRCISNRVAGDKELFDINLWPRTEKEDRESSRWLSDDLLQQPEANRAMSFHSGPSLVGSFGGRKPSEPENQDNTGIQHGGVDVRLSSATPHDLLSAEEYLAEIRETPTVSVQANDGDVSQYVSHHKGHNSTSFLPPTHTTILPTPSISSHTLLAPSTQTKLKSEIKKEELSSQSQIGITSCLDSIVQCFREASTIIDTIKDNPAIAHAPIVLLLAESVKEAPSEIEKEKNRATLRFGEAFQYGDYTAMSSLQQVAVQLRTEFLHLLNQAACDPNRPIDIAQLVDAADSGRYTTIAALHNLKQRLVQSGYGSYRQPEPQAHPAFQSSRVSERVGGSCGPKPSFSGMPLLEQRYHLEGSQGSSVEEDGSKPVISDDISNHVHFRDEDIASQTARRRVSVLGFWRHSRAKSSGFLVDSKQKSDEIAESRKRDNCKPRLQN